MFRPSLAALALALSAAGLAHSASPARHAAAVVPSQAPSAGLAKLSVLYDQSGGKKNSGFGLQSDNMEAPYDAYDTQAADDFTVPAGATWLVSQVEVFGVLLGGLPAPSQNVTIYTDQNGLPGSIVADFRELVGVSTDGSGSYKITLPAKLKLRAGRYWMSVQANSNPSGTIWGWQNVVPIGWGLPAVWRNLGEGYGVGCGSYTYTSDCVAFGFPLDLRFVLRGSVK